ncbi:histidinol dehydrogenase [Streptomyces sp. TLI_171]|uniref:histidinol dehydrogenase n=1 Tax=Streptomyces sp. TLI_171 TaxID=1938859 RepID=UPI000C1A3143|nr:histidinol dehydrogenase [Streptomyces sp. TLI_171]RKE22200.1 histidinol dehydrogenase [Streptomyces sp. TLI_171]
MNAARPEVRAWSSLPEPERRRLLERGAEPPAGLRAAIADLVEDVRTRGDAAVLDALRRFDGLELRGNQLQVSKAEFAAARAALPAGLVAAVRASIAQVRAFNEVVRERGSWRRAEAGAETGEIVRAIDSVGLFVPSGKGSYPSVLIQIGTPAVVAGVERIAVVVPPTPGTGGQVDPAVLVVAEELGIREVYRCNGPAGVAALACGTATVPRVGKIVGPGSPAVAVAQAEVQRLGCVVEPGFGPTDALIVADGSADPRLLAVDLVNEAEHGPDSSAVLVGTDPEVLAAAAANVAEQLAALPAPRAAYAAASILHNGGILLAADRAEAMGIANAYAPEHLQLAVAEPESWLPLVRHAGTVLLGQWTTMAASNFAIGTPATLPTSGYARRVSGVTAATYLTRIAVARLDEPAFRRLAPIVTAFAAHEDFPAHAATVTARA